MHKKAYLFAFVILTGLLAGLAVWVPAQAHAGLLQSVPAAGESLAHSPARVEIYMSEPVEAKLSEITVYNNAGQQVDQKDTHLDPADGAHLIVSLPDLPDGLYTVYWKTASADDGHLTGGSYNFTVGQAVGAAIPAAGGATQTSEAFFSPAQALAKGLLYLAVALLVGGIIFYLFAWRPAADAGSFSAGPAAFRPFWIASLLLAALATLGGIAAEAGLLGGDFLTVLLYARAGLLALVRLAILMALAGLLVPPENRWNRAAALPLSLLLLLTISLLSHAAAQTPALLPVTLDLVHLAAASAWAGGVGVFLWTLLWLRRQEAAAGKRSGLVALLLERFSTLALISAGVLVITGVYAAVLDVGSWQALVDTVYGQALVVKLALALGMIFMGGLNHFVHRPRLVQPGAQEVETTPAGPLVKFRLSLALEVFLSAALLLWVGVFTSLPPAQPATSQIVRTAQAAGGEIELRLAISPGKVGLNTFTLQVSPGQGAALDAVGASLVVFSSNTALPPNDIDLEAAGPQTYSGEAYVLGYPDLWQIRMVVHRSAHLDARADTYVDLRPQPGLPQGTATWLTGGMLAIALAFAGWAILRGGKRRAVSYK